MVRVIMRKFFPLILDITFWIFAVCIFIAGINIMQMQTFSGYLIWEGLGFIVVGLAALILGFGLIYVLLDIRDAVEKNQYK